jgi:hypothetical protein
MIKINKKNLKSEWFDFDEGIKFLIRPFPLSERSLSPSTSNIIEVLIKQAMYCLKEWEGVCDDEDNVLECNEENKKLLFDYSDDVVSFICDKSRELNDKIINMDEKKI